MSKRNLYWKDVLVLCTWLVITSFAIGYNIAQIQCFCTKALTGWTVVTIIVATGLMGYYFYYRF